MRPSPSRLLAVTLLLIAAGCTAAGAPAPSPFATPRPSQTPSPSVSPTPSPVPDPTVETEAEAAARVLASDPRFAGIGPVRDDPIGQSAWYEVHPDGGGYLVTVTVGWGDCIAGCIERRVWEIAVDADGTIEPRSETGDAIPADVVAPEVAGLGTIDLLLLAGPTCPVVTDPPEPGCDGRPVSGATVRVSDAAGDLFAELTSDASGHVVTVLPAGVHVVEPLSVDGLMGTPAPVALWAMGNEVTAFTLEYDTGIR